MKYFLNTVNRIVNKISNNSSCCIIISITSETCDTSRFEMVDGSSILGVGHVNTVELCTLHSCGV